MSGDCFLKFYLVKFKFFIVIHKEQSTACISNEIAGRLSLFYIRLKILNVFDLNKEQLKCMSVLQAVVYKNYTQTALVNMCGKERTVRTCHG